VEEAAIGIPENIPNLDLIHIEQAMVGDLGEAGAPLAQAGGAVGGDLERLCRVVASDWYVLGGILLNVRQVGIFNGGFQANDNPIFGIIVTILLSWSTFHGHRSGSGSS
jgi:hypothetical protein